MTSTSQLSTKIEQHLKKATQKKQDQSLLQALVHSGSHNLHIKAASIDPDQPFHVASIGKMFTATIIGMLAEAGDIRIDDQIANYLPADLLTGLFVYQQHDYKNDITIRQLLGHTSGIADYFESDVHGGAPFIDRILQDPDKQWTPAELVDFTRTHQQALGAPGSFHYSDTGYVLLGMLIEAVTKRSFDTVLDGMIFAPLGMTHTYLMFYRPQAQEIAPIWFNGTEISTRNLLSCDWAGGGVVSTLDDLLKFQQAYWNHQLVSESFVREMSTITGKFRAGMHYGLGMMELRFEGFFFLLRGLPRLHGHSGILSTFMFYDQTNDTHFIVNMGSSKKIPAGIRLLIELDSMIHKSLKK